MVEDLDAIGTHVVFDRTLVDIIDKYECNIYNIETFNLVDCNCVGSLWLSFLIVFFFVD